MLLTNETTNTAVDVDVDVDVDAPRRAGATRAAFRRDRERAPSPGGLARSKG
jgi:hypothetical protein